MFTSNIILLQFIKMKNLKNLGETLNKNEQKLINGGGPPNECRVDYDPCLWHNGAYWGVCFNGNCL